jgi:hypothetical protein
MLTGDRQSMPNLNSNKRARFRKHERYERLTVETPAEAWGRSPNNIEASAPVFPLSSDISSFLFLFLHLHLSRIHILMSAIGRVNTGTSGICFDRRTSQLGVMLFKIPCRKMDVPRWVVWEWLWISPTLLTFCDSCQKAPWVGDCFPAQQLKVSRACLWLYRLSVTCEEHTKSHSNPSAISGASKDVMVVAFDSAV